MKYKISAANYVTVVLTLISFLINTRGIAQSKIDQHLKTISIPFEASRFDTSQRKAKFLVYKGFKAMQISPSPTRNTTPVTLKGLNFTNGTIEFDAQPAEGVQDDAISINFHQQDIYNYESLYLRVQADETPQRNDAIQYTPFIKGINLWDIMTPFRGYALIHNEDWNHIKLVISGMQMLVYVNSATKPTMKVSRLEGDFKTGAISLDGEAIFANLAIKPDAVEGLSPREGLDFTDNDPNYIRSWQVTNPQFLAKGRQLTEDDLPKDTTQWQPIHTERRGLVNLSRKFGGVELSSYQKRNRFVFVKAIIRSDKKQTVRMQLGFNKEAYAFINGRLFYIDKNEAGELYQKYPHGRIDLTNAIINVPLKKGNNELIIGIAAQNYGWGIIGRMMDNMDGVFIEN